MEFIVTLLLPAVLAVFVHTFFLRLSAWMLRVRQFTIAPCALLAFVATASVFALRFQPVVDVDKLGMPLAIAASLLIQGMLGALLLPRFAGVAGTLRRAWLRGAAVAVLAFGLFSGAGTIGLAFLS